jgi:hypothetical protein
MQHARQTGATCASSTEHRRKIMQRIPVVTGVLALAGLALAAPAQARTVWSVSIGGPGYALGAGPAYYGYPHRHWHPRYVAAPIVYPAPVVLAPRVVYRAPVAYAAPVVYPAPRVVYSAPVVVRPW